MPVGRKPNFENGKPKTPNSNGPIWSTCITLWYAPSKRPSGFTLREIERGRTERIYGNASSDYAPGGSNRKTRPLVTMLQIFLSLIHILKIFIFILIDLK